MELQTLRQSIGALVFSDRRQGKISEAAKLISGYISTEKGAETLLNILVKRMDDAVLTDAAMRLISNQKLSGYLD